MSNELQRWRWPDKHDKDDDNDDDVDDNDDDVDDNGDNDSDDQTSAHAKLPTPSKVPAYWTHSAKRNFKDEAPPANGFSRETVYSHFI